MPKTAQTSIACSQCRQPFRVNVHSVIDPADNPQVKIALLSGQLNIYQCPNCGTPNSVLTPILYHDGSKELLVSFTPMELGMSKDAQERAIGELMREVTSSLPQGAFKAYLLQPRSALTMQGLIDQVLQADGVTSEMIQAQRDRVKLVEQFLQANPTTLPELVAKYDAQIDAQFMQTMSLVVQQFLQQGRQDAAERVAMLQNAIVELSTFGQSLIEQNQQQEMAIAEVAEQVNAMGEDATRADFLQLAIAYADDPQRLQALVGLIRPAFDQIFFQEMTAAIAQAPAEDRDRLNALRQQLAELTAMVDQQSQMALQEAANLLRVLLSSPEPDAIIAENLQMLDYTFMQVLSANVQEASRRGDVAASSRLKDIYNRVVNALQANMPPELRFINEMLNAPTDFEAQQMLAEHGPAFGAGLAAAMDAVEGQLAQGSPAIQERFAMLRRAVANLK